MTSSSGTYVREVAVIHRKYQAALKRAKTRQQVLNAYWKHKKESERLLAKHLKEELKTVKNLKEVGEYTGKRFTVSFYGGVIPPPKEKDPPPEDSENH